MKKFILSIVLIAVVVIAAPNGYFRLNSDGSIDMIASTAIVDTVEDVASITFTNGWSIQCTTNGLEFVAP